MAKKQQITRIQPDKPKKRAIAFYSNRSNKDWYHFTLELWWEVAHRTATGQSEFRRTEQLYGFISKDMSTYQSATIDHDFGGNAMMSAAAKTAHELVRDKTRVNQPTPLRVVTLRDYSRLRRVVLALAEQARQNGQTLSDYADLLDFSSDQPLIP